MVEAHSSSELNNVLEINGPCIMDAKTPAALWGRPAGTETALLPIKAIIQHSFCHRLNLILSPRPTKRQDSNQAGHCTG